MAQPNQDSVMLSQKPQEAMIGPNRTRLYWPKGDVQGVLLVLPGYRHEPERLMEETRAAEWAGRDGWLVVSPFMDRSVYMPRFYPETDWEDQHAGLLVGWFAETLYPLLDGAYPPEEFPWAVLGISTGGRGAVRLAALEPQRFRAVLAFSGDFDATVDPRDRTLAYWFGPYEEFPERWKTVGNPIAEAASMQTPIFLYHAQQDAIVPVEHTRRYRDKLMEIHPHLPVEVWLQPGKEHDYPGWDAALEPAWCFLTRHSGLELPIRE